MGALIHLRGRVTELGRSQQETAEYAHRSIRMATYEYIVVEASDGPHRLPGCLLLGDAAYELDVGLEVELMYAGPVPRSGEDAWGNKQATIVCAMRNVTDDGDWLGLDVADVSGKMCGQHWMYGIAFIVLSPVIALCTFWCGGLGGIWSLWAGAKAIRAALRLPPAPDIINAIEAEQRKVAKLSKVNARVPREPAPAFDLLAQ